MEVVRRSKTEFRACGTTILFEYLPCTVYFRHSTTFNLFNNMHNRQYSLFPGEATETQQEK